MDELGARDGPRTVAGRYVLGEVIGRGGRGVVHEAVDPLLQRRVAVKLFHATGSTPEEVRAQEAEARLAAGLNHHALTTLLDAGVETVGTDAPVIYLVMERIPGIDLRRRIGRDGPLSPAQLAYLGFDLADGLQFVHEHGFVHRDIKPANILLADRGIDTRIRGKLTDFGIARIIGSPDPSEWTTGTAAYLSPEQVDGQDATPASDVYSLGLVLLEALTGRVAFPGSVRVSAFARLDQDPEIPASVPAVLAATLRRMTALSPEDRPDLDTISLAFQSAFVQDLVEAGRVAHGTIGDRDRELERLAAVRRFDILDTPPDDAFDRVTHLACRLLDVPTAFVSIVDVDREWFKSRRGLLADVDQIDRGSAICAAAVRTGERLAIRDLRSTRVTRNPLLDADPALRAMAAVPLTTQDGHAIGTLCVFDRRVRDFSEVELDDLEQLAAIAMRELDLRLASRRAIFAR